MIRKVGDGCYQVGEDALLVVRRGDVVRWRLVVEGSPAKGWDVLTVDELGDVVEEHELGLPIARAVGMARGLARSREAWEAES